MLSKWLTFLLAIVTSLVTLGGYAVPHCGIVMDPMYNGLIDFRGISYKVSRTKSGDIPEAIIQCMGTCYREVGNQFFRQALLAYYPQARSIDRLSQNQAALEKRLKFFLDDLRIGDLLTNTSVVRAKNTIFLSEEDLQRRGLSQKLLRPYNGGSLEEAFLDLTEINEKEQTSKALAKIYVLNRKKTKEELELENQLNIEMYKAVSLALGEGFGNYSAYLEDLYTIFHNTWKVRIEKIKEDLNLQAQKKTEAQKWIFLLSKQSAYTSFFIRLLEKHGLISMEEVLKEASSYPKEIREEYILIFKNLMNLLKNSQQKWEEAKEEIFTKAINLSLDIKKKSTVVKESRVEHHRFLLQKSQHTKENKRLNPEVIQEIDKAISMQKAIYLRLRQPFSIIQQPSIENEFGIIYQTHGYRLPKGLNSSSHALHIVGLVRDSETHRAMFIEVEGSYNFEKGYFNRYLIDIDYFLSNAYQVIYGTIGK